MSRFGEFFQSDSGKPCLAHLILFMAWFPATYVLIETKTSDALAVYLMAFVLNRGWGKYIDSKNQGDGQ
jgi:hypothetical protein